MFECIVSGTPNTIQELGSRKHLRWVLHEIGEQIELSGRQIQMRAGAARLAPIQIELQFCGSHASQLQGRFSRQLLNATQNRFYSGGEFNDAKWFGEIVIGTVLKAADAIELAGACGQHEDRGVGGANAHVSTYLQAIEAR